MRRVMAQDLDTLRHVARDDRHLGVTGDDGRQIARLAVDLDRDRRLGEAGADRRRQVDAADRTGKGAAAAVRQRYRDRHHAMRLCPRAGDFGHAVVIHHRPMLRISCRVGGVEAQQKTPSVAGGVPSGSSLLSVQRARPPGTPPSGVVVVLC